MSTQTNLRTSKPRPWLSGYCNPGSPPHMHPHCRMFTATGTPCSCTCHASPWPVEPQVWEGDNA